MGLGSSSRAHYRPLSGGFNRSPSFLVAALGIGFCILAFSYWRLALQYHDLEQQIKHLVQKKDSLEASQSVINKQLEQREENFSEAKVSLQKKVQQVEDLQKKIEQTEKELKEIRVNVDSMKTSNEKLKTEINEKDRNIELIRAQNKKLEEEKTKCEDQVTVLKKTQTAEPKPQASQSVDVKPVKSVGESIFKLEASKAQQVSADQVQAPVVLEKKPSQQSPPLEAPKTKSNVIARDISASLVDSPHDTDTL